MRGRRKKSNRARSRQRGRDWRSFLDEEPDSFEKHGRERTPEPQAPVEPAPAQGSAMGAAEPEGPIGLVLSITSRYCRVSVDGEERVCRLRKNLALHQQSTVAVGDRVTLGSGRGREWVTGVLPRKTVLSRPDPSNPQLERVTAANVDLVVVVAAVREPPLKPGLVDRYLVAVERGGAEALVCINKVDLLEGREDDPELEQLEPYRRLGLPVVCCSAATGQGLDELLSHLAGKLCVLVGHSGVGKSSLLNALVPELELDTQPVKEEDGTGRHTTTRSRLFELRGGARVIDTPGIRELGLGELSAEEVRDVFPDLQAFAGGCRFANCSHTHEPDCGVRRAVDAGEASGERYEAFLRLFESVDG